MKKCLLFLTFVFFITSVFCGNKSISKVLPDFCIEESNDSTSHGFPVIGSDREGNFTVIWTTVINNYSWFYTTEIWGKRYQISGDSLTPKFKINDDIMFGEGAPMLPTSIDVNNVGDFIITWVVYFQRYNSHAEPKGSNTQIKAKAATYGWNSAVGIEGSGNFTIVWDNFYIQRGIYGQRFNAEGDSLGAAFRINNPYHEEIWNPAIAMNETGDFIVVWEKGRYGEDGIYGQLYNNNGEPEGTNFKISDDTDSAYHGKTSVAIDSSGDIFAVVWQDNRLEDYNLYCQLYRSGEPQGVNFIVNEEDNDSTSWFAPAIAMDESGRFVITWSDKRNGNQDIYGQCYDSNGEAIGKNFIVNTEKEGNQGQPSVELKNGYIYNTWTDGNIWANVIEFPDISSIEDENSKLEIPYNFKLCQNYPNPFNLETTIKYNLPKTSFMTLKIYNILGKEVITLVNENQPAGYQSIVWNGTDHSDNPVPSGIYICRMTAGNFTKSQKMLLMK